MNDYDDISWALMNIAFMFIEVAIMLFIWNTALIPWFCFPSITYWQMFVIKIFINMRFLLVIQRSNSNGIL